MTIIEQARATLEEAKEVVIFTGAGISAESGIPTYGEPLTGIWSGTDPRELETAKAFRDNPALVWGWYLWRRRRVARAKPNAAHDAIAQLSQSGRTVSVITQNIDDLHERAGSPEVIHLHGSLNLPKCFACHRFAATPPQTSDLPDKGALVEPPRCQRCNGKMRPAVVWFGEDLPTQVWKTAIARVKSCDVLVSVGTSGIVMPAAGIPELALSSGATVIHVNIAEVSLGERKEIMILGKAADSLPLLIGAIAPL